MCSVFIFFFFNDTATTEIYTLSLHDALPIYGLHLEIFRIVTSQARKYVSQAFVTIRDFSLPAARSEEHTSELQSRVDLVCRLLLEKKKKTKKKQKCSTKCRIYRK